MKSDYVIWVGTGSSNKTEGGDSESCVWNFTLKYDANGGSVTKTLFAVWQRNADKVTLTYMDRRSQYKQDTYDKGATATVVDCTNTRTNYEFKGWSTDSSATRVDYEVGDTFTINQNMTLYAVWEEKQTFTTANYKVKWYNTDGNTIKGDEARNGNAGETVAVTHRDQNVEGYTFADKDARNVMSDTLKETGTVLKLYFTKNHEHNFTRENDEEWMTPPDCITDGVAKFVCSCGAHDDRTVTNSKMGHTFEGAKWINNCTSHEDADCTDHTQTCTRCSGTLKDGYETKTENHNYGEWIVDTAATMITAGTKHRVCSDCGHTERGNYPHSG